MYISCQTTVVWEKFNMKIDQFGREFSTHQKPVVFMAQLKYLRYKEVDLPTLKGFLSLSNPSRAIATVSKVQNKLTKSKNKKSDTYLSIPVNNHFSLCI